MHQTRAINPNDVGQAFLQHLAASSTYKTKSKRRTAFNKLIRALRSLSLLPAHFTPHYITLGVDKNGEPAVLVAGDIDEHA